MSEPVIVDLNADLGESFGTWALGDDRAMLEVVSSANVACGFHAGDPRTIRHTVRLADGRDVAVGAQVGYPDLVGFGRRFIDMEPDDLEACVIYQVGALDALCRAEGTSVRYVKPHGALYNATVHHPLQARAVVAAVRRYDAELPILGLPGSMLLAEASEAGLTTIAEAFADRAYTHDGGLVPRTEPGAVLNDPELVARRVLRLVTEGVVESVDGIDVVVSARSVCIHGDSPSAVTMARAVRTAMGEHDVVVAPFA
ncbi:MAG: LamB/YcsF family protein [Nostocoides sp.]